MRSKLVAVKQIADSGSVNLKSSVTTDNSTTGSFVVDHLGDGGELLTLFVHLLAYVAILAFFVLVFYLIMKYVANFDDGRNVEESRETETNPLLLPTKATPFSYGTCNNDLEAGNCSSVDCRSSRSSFSEELYDAKLCVICYDEERNCFFVPCGHCATCYFCAQRILNEENKVCPVCRRLIGKVRKLFAP